MANARNTESDERGILETNPGTRAIRHLLDSATHAANDTAAPTSAMHSTTSDTHCMIRIIPNIGGNGLLQADHPAWAWRNPLEIQDDPLEIRRNPLDFVAKGICTFS